MYNVASQKTSGITYKGFLKLNSPINLITPVHIPNHTHPPTITLTPLSINHLEDFLEWATDDEVTKHLLWNSYSSPSEAKTFLETVVAQHPWFKAICVDKKIIGSITLDRGTGCKSCKAELGYVVAKKYWSRGYGTAAVKEALRTGFKELDVERIEALVDPDNIASQKILEKCGFVREGCLASYILHKGMLRDRIIFGITRDHYLHTEGK
ncbi:hypothetical protein SCG7086_AW_00230 [Chlamydiales bacterium SCGC AG-110-P3]|nr:hypothetical protein SCG7086_AW_00230 [Chlamydiales bacterium SCGC AG-110-P3]